MKLNKRNLIIISLIVILLVSMAGCKGQKQEDPGSGSGTTDKVYQIKFGHNQDTNSPQHRGVEAFKQKVEELSNGRVQVTIYPNMQLGQMREQAEQCSNGTLEIIFLVREAKRCHPLQIRHAERA
jgi:TRAP-type C4-dicarboxylate transport system substrate-binding protein